TVGGARQIFGTVPLSHRNFRSILALRRYRLDLSLPAALPHQPLFLMSTTILPRKMYFLIWAALMFLLLLTWGAAQINLGRFNAAVALTIALLKMLLVLLYFMHVRYSSRMTWLFAAAGFIWFLIMIDLTLSDYLTRIIEK